MHKQVPTSVLVQEHQGLKADHFPVICKFAVLDSDVNFDQSGSVNSSHGHSCMKQLSETQLYYAFSCLSQNVNSLPKVGKLYYFIWDITNI